MTFIGALLLASCGSEKNNDAERFKSGVFEKMKFPYFSLPNNSECVSETISFCHNLKAAVQNIS